MKQVLIDNGNVIVEEVPAPLVDDNGVLIEVGYSLISSGTELSELKQSRKTLLQRASEQPENVRKIIEIFKEKGINKTISVIQEKASIKTPTGYSCSGIVLQVGKEVVEFAPGDRVACAGAGYASHAEVVMVPKNLVVKVPNKCDLRDAASVTLGSIAMQGIRRADPRIGEIVAVIGLGLLGQITTQLLQVSGCHVVGFDLLEERIEKAISNGMEYGFNPKKVNVEKEIRFVTESYGVDTTIITASSTSDDIVQQSMNITRKKGKVVVVGDVGLRLERNPFYKKEIDFLISSSYGPGRYDDTYEKKGLDYPYAYVRWTENRNMDEFLKLIAKGDIDIKSIVEHEFSIDDAHKAYTFLQSSKENHLGVLISYGLDRKEHSNKYSTKININHFNKKYEDKISVALVGAGSFAKSVHLKNLQKLSEHYYLRAIVSGSGINAKDVAERYNADYATTEYQEVLEDNNIDMVMICTRHNLHAEMAIRAAKAQKSIFLEKPMATELEDLNNLVEVLEKTNTFIMVGFNRRFSPVAKIARSIIQKRNNPSMILYRVNAGYLPPDHWTQTNEGGGRIIGEICHMIDLIQFLVFPAIVESYNSSTVLSQDSYKLKTNDAVVNLNCSDDSVATIFYSTFGSKDLDKEYIEIYNSGMTLLVDDFKSLRVLGSNEKGWKGNQQNKGHLEELRSFAQNLKGKGDELISLEEMKRTTEISIRVAKRSKNEIL